jgi:branched-chain amino acid transport system substrate-binding protein
MKRIWRKGWVMGIFVVLLVALLATLPACSSTSTTPSASSTTSSSSPTSTQAQGPSEILLGAVVAQTGAASSFGQGAFGLQAAVDDLNKDGGIFVKEYNRKIPVRIKILDSQSDTTKIGTLAQSLILTDKANFLVVSPSWPQDIAAAADVAERLKTPFVAYAGPFEPNMGIREASGGWKYTWESGFAIGQPPPEGDFRANLVGYTNIGLWMSYLQQFGSQTNKKVAAFASDDPDGRGWYGAFVPALQGAGFTVIGADKDLGVAPGDTTDFSPMIREWIDAGAELLMGNAPAPWVGTLLRQCQTMGFQPKVIIAEKAAMLYDDIMSWGGQLPMGVMALIEWTPAIKNSVGIGDTTSPSLNDRWTAATGEPYQPMVGCGYSQVQILADAIQRAGTLDKDAVNAAIAQTDMTTIRGRAKFDVNQFNRFPIAYGQWFPAPDPVKWQMKIIFAGDDFTVESAPMFPIPYK